MLVCGRARAPLLRTISACTTREVKAHGGSDFERPPWASIPGVRHHGYLPRSLRSLCRCGPWACSSAARAHPCCSSRSPCTCKIGNARHLGTKAGTFRKPDRPRHLDAVSTIVLGDDHGKIRIPCTCKLCSALQPRTTTRTLRTASRQWPTACKVYTANSPGICSMHNAMHQSTRIRKEQQMCRRPRWAHTGLVCDWLRQRAETVEPP